MRSRCKPRRRTRERRRSLQPPLIPAQAGIQRYNKASGFCPGSPLARGRTGTLVVAPVKILSPKGAIKPTGTWSLGARAGDFIFVAGMRGIDSATNTLVAGPEQRIRQAFQNMMVIANSEGALPLHCVRLTVF